MKDTTKVITALVALFLVIVGSCEIKDFVKEKSPQRVEVVSETIDTMYHPVQFVSAREPQTITKTVYVENEVYKAPYGYKLVPNHFVMVDGSTIVHPAISRVDTQYIVLDEINTYNDVVEDSLLSFSYAATTAGTLENIDFSYEIKAPKAITKTVEKIKYVPVELNEFFLGAGVIADDSRGGFSVGASMLTKKHFLTSYDYDVVNRQHAISFKYRIFAK